ncbi:MAG: TonB family protein [Candidatus Omnitrophota bacterium]
MGRLSKKNIFVLICGLSVVAVFAPGVVTNAQESEITLVIPQIKAVSVYSPRRVAVSNPEIVDVSSVSEKEVILAPKSAGKATLVVWDKMGERAYPLRVLSGDLNDLKLRIDRLVSAVGYGDVRSQISREESKILLLGNVDSEEEKQRLSSVLSGFSDRIIDIVEIAPETRQVQINMEILEISKSALEDLGFDWTSSVSGSSSSGTAAIKWSENGSAVSREIPDIAYLSRVWDRGIVSAQLNLIITKGNGRVLSRPKLLCMSGKEARFLVGGEIPVVTTSTTGGGTATNATYKEYGVSLEIKPVVKPGGFVQAALKTDVSEIDNGNAVTASGIVIPALSTRTAETELYLKDGQTVFLAGLIKNKDSHNYSKLPALGDIPILGALFRSRNFEEGETELVISLTPHIVLQHSDEEKKDNTKQQVDEGASSGPAHPGPRTLVGYIRAVQEKIVRAVVYPDLARRENAYGEVGLSLHLLADGRLLNVVVNKSSGSAILDNASVNIVKSQAPFSPIPKASGLSEIWIDIPIVFED